MPALGETTAIVLQTKIALKILKVWGCFHFCDSLYTLGICLIPLWNEAEATTKEWTVLELPWHRTSFAVPVVLGTL